MGKEHPSPVINLASVVAIGKRWLFRFRPNSTTLADNSVANKHAAGLPDAPSYVEASGCSGTAVSLVNKCEPERASAGCLKASARLLLLPGTAGYAVADVESFRGARSLAGSAVVKLL